MPADTLFTIYIKMLGVPHTAIFSNSEYKSYPPKLAFMAFQDLLYEYHIGRHLVTADASKPLEPQLQSLTLPCVIQSDDGKPVIVTSAGEQVEYVTMQGKATAPVAEFVKRWNGKAIEAAVQHDSAEPEWRRHRFHHLAAIAEHYAFWVLTAAVAVYFFVSNRLYASWSLTLLTILYALGIATCWLLTLKQNNVHSASAEAVCSVIEKTGCTTVVNSEQGMFMGLFHWSEIGLAFFTVSLGALLVYPAVVNYLAYISILCLPYSFWSVYTQHWKLHSWCTLCLTVQALFWIIFGISIGGGHLHSLFPLQWDAGILTACYGIALLLFHKIVPAYFAYESRAATSTTTAA